jgi:hypothetical protein
VSHRPARLHRPWLVKSLKIPSMYNYCVSLTEATAQCLSTFNVVHTAQFFFRFGSDPKMKRLQGWDADIFLTWSLVFFGLCITTWQGSVVNSPQDFPADYVEKIGRFGNNSAYLTSSLKRRYLSTTHNFILHEKLNVSIILLQKSQIEH